jgi:protein-S-isoprenylcysteine O-methyltransferase Ste14
MDLKLKIPPAIVTIVIAGAMWWIAQNFSYNWATFDSILRIEIIFLGIGGILGLAGLIQFYRSSTSIDPHKPDKTSKLVTDGIYSISRNPMYLGLLFILIGYGFYLANLFTFLLLPLFVIYMNRYQIIPEEEIMERKFGDEYLRYKSEVRRWL